MDCASAVTPEALVLFADDARPWCPSRMNRASRVGVLLCGWATLVLGRETTQPLMGMRQAVRAMIAERVMNPERPASVAELELMDATAQMLLDAELALGLCGVGFL